MDTYEKIVCGSLALPGIDGILPEVAFCQRGKYYNSGRWPEIMNWAIPPRKLLPNWRRRREIGHCSEWRCYCRCVLRTAVTGGGARSCPSGWGRDRVPGSGSRKLSWVKYAPTILSKSCHGRVVPVHSPTNAIYTEEHLLCYSTRVRNSHSTIAAGCLRYLNFGYFRLFLIFRPAPLIMSPLESTSFYPGEYIRGMTEIFIRLSLGLPVRFAEHISTQLLL